MYIGGQRVSVPYFQTEDELKLMIADQTMHYDVTVLKLEDQTLRVRYQHNFIVKEIEDATARKNRIRKASAALQQRTRLREQSALEKAARLESMLDRITVAEELREKINIVIQQSDDIFTEQTASMKRQTLLFRLNSFYFLNIDFKINIFNLQKFKHNRIYIIAV